MSLFLPKLHSWWTNLLALPKGSRRRRKPRRNQPDKTPPEDFWRSWRGWAAGWRRRNSVAAPGSSSCSCTTSWGTWWGRWWPNCTRASVSQTPNPKNASHYTGHKDCCTQKCECRTKDDFVVLPFIILFQFLFLILKKKMFTIFFWNCSELKETLRKVQSLI